MFQTLAFDVRVGPEVALLFLDDPGFSRKLGRMKPFRLFARSGAVRTTSGVIWFVIWTVRGRFRHVVDYEHTLNPFNPDTIELLRSAGEQSHLKVNIIDSFSSEFVGFYEFSNDFGLDRFAVGLEQIAATVPKADFMATQAALRNEFTLKELKKTR